MSSLTSVQKIAGFFQKHLKGKHDLSPSTQARGFCWLLICLRHFRLFRVLLGWSRKAVGLEFHSVSSDAVSPLGSGAGGSRGKQRLSPHLMQLRGDRGQGCMTRPQETMTGLLLAPVPRGCQAGVSLCYSFLSAAALQT